MKIFLIFLFVSTAAAAPRIIGGKPINNTEAPWTAQVNGRIWDFVFQCGAVIIGPNTALTAGHCVGRSTTREIKMVSSSTIVDFGNWHDVIKYVRHPDFVERDENEYDNDIAIIFVAQSFVTEDDPARPINISKVETQAGDQALISGYGYAGVNETQDVLRSIVVPILDRNECNQTYEGKIGADKICGGPLNGGKGVCTADNGGPVVVNGALVGIVSSNGKLCHEDGTRPEIYTNVAYFRDWIEEQQNLFQKEQMIMKKKTYEKARKLKSNKLAIKYVHKA